MNLIKQLKRISIPPCSQCTWAEYKSTGSCFKCTNPDGLNLLEKLTGEARRDYMESNRVRATKYCNFKTEGGE